MAAVIVFSLLFGTWRSVNDARAKGLDEFYRDMGIATDLRERQIQAYNMVTLALKYVSSADETVKAVLSARSDLMSAEGISQMYSANRVLTDTTTALDAKLRNMELEESDAQNLSRTSAELVSRNSTIGHDSYNRTAQKFNSKILGGFPSKFISSLFGIKELELFR